MFKGTHAYNCHCQNNSSSATNKFFIIRWLKFWGRIIIINKPGRHNSNFSFNAPLDAKVQLVDATWEWILR